MADPATEVDRQLTLILWQHDQELRAVSIDLEVLNDRLDALARLVGERNV